MEAACVVSTDTDHATASCYREADGAIMSRQSQQDSAARMCGRRIMMHSAGNVVTSVGVALTYLLVPLIRDRTDERRLELD